jgi:TRAP-type C4-dicarboxylate transport system permease small subunit
MAYFCGLLFLLLGFYTALDVFGRRYVGVFSGVTDEIGGYVLAFGASWALAYTLREGGHVRVDVLLPRFSPGVRKALDTIAMALMAVFAFTLTVNLWKLVGNSYAMQATGHSLIQTPQWIPQAMMATGYMALGVFALMSVIADLLETYAARKGRLEHS